jgi:isopenicillin N synthase-like dioxygenase
VTLTWPCPLKTFIVGREVPADDPEAGSFMTGPNLWPDIPREDFQDVVLAYQACMVELSRVIIRMLVQGLPKEWGCPIDALDGLTVDPAIPMRFLHYGPVEKRDPRQFGGMLPITFAGLVIYILVASSLDGLV